LPLAANSRPAAKKKSLHSSERDTPRVQQARAEYAQEIKPLAVRGYKFVDESGINLSLTRLYGRAPRGQRAVGSTPINYGEKVSLIAALGSSGLDAPMMIAGAVDGDVFRVWTEQVLCPTLAACDIVIMDNLQAHKVRGIREAIEGRGARLLYLPPYSPDLSPIEPMLVEDQDSVADRRRTDVSGVGASDQASP
jgi:hypothetical protein